MFLIFPKTIDQIRVCAHNIRDVSRFGLKDSKSINFSLQFRKIFDFDLKFSKGIKTLLKTLEKYLILAWNTQKVLNFYAKIDNVPYFVKITFEKHLVLTQNI